MARQPRLSLPGVVHLLVQRGHNGGAIVHDEIDVEQLRQILHAAAREQQVALHAYALLPRRLLVLATPASAEGISRMMQAIGRRHAAAFNHRHGRSGALWDGRFRSALIEDGEPTLQVLCLIDADPAEDGQRPLCGNRAHRSGASPRDPGLVDPPAYWQLGNTPFEREARYRERLTEPVPQAQGRALQRALTRSAPYGSAAFIARLGLLAGRELQPRPRGRPPRAR